MEQQEIKLKPFQVKQTEILRIFEKAHYDIYFTVVETLTEFYVMFRLYGTILRLAPLEEVQQIVEQYASAYGVMTYKQKLITDSDYLNLQDNINFWEKKKRNWENKGNTIVDPFINEELNKFYFYQDKTLTEEYRCKIFGATEKEVLNNAFLFVDTFGQVITPVPLRKKEVQRYLRQEHNPLEKRRAKDE